MVIQLAPVHTVLLGSVGSGDILATDEMSIWIL